MPTKKDNLENRVIQCLKIFVAKAKGKEYPKPQ